MFASRCGESKKDRTIHKMKYVYSFASTLMHDVQAEQGKIVLRKFLNDTSEIYSIKQHLI